MDCCWHFTTIYTTLRRCIARPIDFVLNGSGRFEGPRLNCSSSTYYIFSFSLCVFLFFFFFLFSIIIFAIQVEDNLQTVMAFQWFDVWNFYLYPFVVQANSWCFTSPIKWKRYFWLPFSSVLSVSFARTPFSNYFISFVVFFVCVCIE